MSPEFIKSANLSQVILIKPDVFSDPRGFFLETYHADKYSTAGIDKLFVQDNHSHSRRNTLRGLHYQLKHPQAKLVFVITGEIFDVAVDIRRDSPTFGTWTGAILSEKNKHQIFVPCGFAHGFCVLSETADVIYKCTDLYKPGDDHGILWSDPSIGIDWHLKAPTLSDKDTQNPLLEEISDELLPVYQP